MEQKRERIWELDALRGFCIVCVIFVHFMFDLVYFLGKQVDFPPLYTFIQQYGGAIFVVLSGCCATLGSRSFRRGVLVFGCGMLITLVTFGMYRMGMAASDVVVKFGVLHLLGVCMMLYPLLKKLPTTALSVLAAAIVAIGYAIQGMRFSVRWLFPLGFVYPGFTSSDFFRSCRSSAGSCSASSSAGRSIMKSGRFCPARHRIFSFSVSFSGAGGSLSGSICCTSPSSTVSSSWP